MKYEDIKRIAEEKDQQGFVGLIEGQHFDAKSQPYLFNSSAAKHEYAKDLVSFLNAEGGFILLGGVTQISAVHSGEEVTELKWFPKSLLSLQAYTDLIVEWIYPIPVGIDFHIFDSNDGKILCLIEIPNQESNHRPFLIVKSQLDEKSKVDHHIVGWARRFSDRTTRVDKTDIHKWLQSGMMLEDKLSGQLSRILNILESREAKDSTPSEAPDSSEVTTTEISQDAAALPTKIDLSTVVASRVNESASALEVSGDRFLGMAIYPIGGDYELPSIFKSRRSPVVELMTNPPVLRQSGWDIISSLDPKITSGEFLRANDSGRRILDVYRDGTTVFIGAVHHDLLAWGADNNRRIHPLALIETVRSFVAFYEELLKHFSVRPPQIGFALRLENMRLNEEPCQLSPHATGSLSFRYATDDKDAPKNLFEKTRFFSANAFETDVVTYQVVREIYIWFGFTEDAIPYTQEKEGKKEINSAEIAKIR